MENSKTYQYYKELPTWAKGVAVVGVLVAVGLVGYGIIKKLQQDAKNRAAQKKLNDVRNELENQTNQGVVRSYPKSQYNAWAGELEDQFAGCDISIGAPFGIVSDYYDLSNSGKKLYDIASKLNNDIDYLELVDSFDIRTYDDCGIWNGDVENVTLNEAISNELNTSEIAFINNLMKNHSISYKF